MSDTVSYILKSSTAQSLGAIASIMSKAKAHAEAAGIEESVFLNSRVYPDMFPFVRQIQIACDTCRRGAYRLTKQEASEIPDDETSFDQLIARCHSAIADVNAMDDAAINANTLETLQIPMGDQMMPMTGQQYLASFILPNLHFHTSIAFALLRSQGVVIGKRDYLLP